MHTRFGTIYDCEKLQQHYKTDLLKVFTTLQEIAPKMMEDEFDYDAAANFMWSCTMA